MAVRAWHPCRLLRVCEVQIEVVTHQHTWHPCRALLSPMASSPYLALFPRNLVSNGPADAALVSLLTLHWHPCPHCAGGITSIALLSSPALRITALVAWASLPPLCWTCHPHCTRIAVSIANWRLPHHNTIVKRQHTWRCQQAHCRPLWFLLPEPAPFPGNLAFMSGQSSTGSFAGVALASLPMSRWHPHKHCAVVIASVALALLPMLHWPLCPHCTGITPSIATGVCPTTTQSQHIRVHGVVVVVIVLACGLIVVPSIVPR
jgi:hypothetical protein